MLGMRSRPCAPSPIERKDALETLLGELWAEAVSSARNLQMLTGICMAGVPPSQGREQEKHMVKLISPETEIS